MRSLLFSPLMLLVTMGIGPCASRSLGSAQGPNADARVDGQSDAAIVMDGAAAGEGGRDEASDPDVPGLVTNKYVPQVAFPFDNQYLSGGSVEELPGFGWDLCSTRTAGLTMHVDSGGSAGPRHLTLQSGECTGTCGPDHPSSSQFYMLFNNIPPSADPMGLYFEVINLGESPSEGTMTFYGTNQICQGEAKLMDVPLAALAVTNTWSTRCVNLSVVGVFPALGIAVSGAPHKIGLDAFRMGPTCQRPVDCSMVACSCIPGANQTCNDEPTISSLHGTCQPDGTCTCRPGFEKNLSTGRCP